MHIAGIFGKESDINIANLIQSFLGKCSVKANIIGRKAFQEMNEKTFKSYINHLLENNTDLLVLNLEAKYCLKSVFDSLKLDMALYYTNNICAPDDSSVMARIFDIIKPKGILIISDDFNLPILNETDKQVLTYGFGDSASISASSTGMDLLNEGICSFLFSLQKSIKTLQGSLAEPQEYKINANLEKLQKNSVLERDLLAAGAFAVVNGII